MFRTNQIKTMSIHLISVSVLFCFYRCRLSPIFQEMHAALFLLLNYPHIVRIRGLKHQTRCSAVGTHWRSHESFGAKH